MSLSCYYLVHWSSTTFCNKSGISTDVFVVFLRGISVLLYFRTDRLTMSSPDIYFTVKSHSTMVLSFLRTQSIVQEYATMRGQVGLYHTSEDWKDAMREKGFACMLQSLRKRLDQRRSTHRNADCTSHYLMSR